MFPLQALPRCPEVDKPAASKAQDAKHAVLFPVVDGSATGAGGTVEQIGSFREKRQFDKLGFFHNVSEPVAEGLPCQSLRQSFHIYVVRLTYPFYRKASVFNPGMVVPQEGGEPERKSGAGHELTDTAVLRYLYGRCLF